MRPDRLICSPASPSGYPLPSQRSWCWLAASAHSPSHGRSGSSSGTAAAGCCLRISHSSSSGRPVLLRISGGTSSLPMSWTSPAQCNLSRSPFGRWSSSPIINVYARTRSVCPRVLRSWLFRAPARDTSRSAASWKSGWSTSPASRARSSWRSVLVRRATLNRDGAWSGKTSDRLNSATSGITLRITRSVAASTTVEARVRPTHHSATPNHPAGRGTSRLTIATNTTDSTIGVSRTIALSVIASTGRSAHRFASGGPSGARVGCVPARGGSRTLTWVHRHVSAAG